MSWLKKRIARQAGSQAPLSPVAHNVPGPDFAPPQQILVWAPGTVGLEPMAPMITADGALVPATMPGAWDQLRAAGRP
jgi:hypothetical protein